MLENIIEMSPFLTDNRFPELAEIDAYWTALRGQRVMPRRDEVDPRGIEGALANSFLLEQVPPGPTRIRLAGSGLNDLMGMEIRGMALQSLFTPHYHRPIEALCDDVCRGPGVAQIWLCGESQSGQPAIEARMTLWPLADARGQATRILGALSCKGEAGQAPRRFHIASSRFLEIETGRGRTGKRIRSFAEAERHFNPAPRARSAATAPAPQVPQPPTPAPSRTQRRSRLGAGGTPYLWLVKSD